MDIPEKRYLNIQELAEYLGVSRWSLYKLVQRRRIPFIPFTVENSSEPKKNLVRFDLKEIDRWMAKRSVKPIKDY